MPVVCALAAVSQAVSQPVCLSCWGIPCFLFLQLLRSGLIERHELYQQDLLLDYLLRVNDVLSQREMSQWEHMIGPEAGQYVRSKSNGRLTSLCVCVLLCVYK